MLLTDILLESNDIIERAKQHFGVTHDPRECGYILPDGTMLDLSGRHTVSNYQRAADGRNVVVKGRDYFTGTRQIDHRDLGPITEKDGTEGMLEFMRLSGAIRFSPGNGFSVVCMPTPRQLSVAVAGHFSITEDPLFVDIINDQTGSVIASKEFTRRSIAPILNFIRKTIG